MAEKAQELQSSVHGRIKSVWGSAMRSLVRAEQSAIPPGQMLWPVRLDTEAKQLHINAHSAMVQFRDELLGYSDDYADLWGETITRLDDDSHPINIEHSTLSLSSMGKWTREYATLTYQDTDSVRGRQQRTETVRVLLPVAALRDVYRQLTELAAEIGFIVEPPEIDIEDGSGGL